MAFTHLEVQVASPVKAPSSAVEQKIRTFSAALLTALTRVLVRRFVVQLMEIMSMSSSRAHSIA